MISKPGPETVSPTVFLAAICSARIFLYFRQQNYTALIPVLQIEWHMSNTAAGSIVSACQTGFLISMVSLAALSDWVSPKKVFLYSCIAFAASCFLFALFAHEDVTVADLDRLAGKPHQPLDVIGLGFTRVFEYGQLPTLRIGDLVGKTIDQDLIAGIRPVLRLEFHRVAAHRADGTDDLPTSQPAAPPW